MSGRSLLQKTVDALYFALLVSWLLIFFCLFINEFAKPTFFSTHFLDFARFFSAAQLAASPERTHIYDLQTQYRWLSHLLAYPGIPMPDITSDPHKLFIFFSEQPLPFFFFYMPFIALPLHAAFVACNAAFFLMGSVAAWLLADIVRANGGTEPAEIVKLSTVQKLILLVGAMASGPALSGLLLGHAEWLLAGLAGLYIYFFLRGQDIAAGIALALMVAKPQYGLFLGLAPLFTRRWKLLGATFASALIILGICVAMFGLHNVLDYPNVLAKFNYVTGGQHWQMVSLRGLFDDFLPFKLATDLSVLTTILGLLGVAFVWHRTARQKADPAASFALTVVASLLFGPHNFRYDCLLILIPAALLLPNVSLSAALSAGSRRSLALSLLLYPVLSSAIIYVLMPHNLSTVLYFLVNAWVGVSVFLRWLQPAPSADL